MTAVRRMPLMELMWRTHRFLFRASGGRIGAQLGALSVLIAVAVLEPMM